MCWSVKDDSQKQIINNFVNILQSDKWEESFIDENSAPTENEHLD